MLNLKKRKHLVMWAMGLGYRVLPDGTVTHPETTPKINKNQNGRFLVLRDPATKKKHKIKITCLAGFQLWGERVFKKPCVTITHRNGDDFDDSYANLKLLPIRAVKGGGRKCTQEDAVNMRQAYWIDGNVSVQELSKKYNLSEPQIRRILRGVSYVEKACWPVGKMTEIKEKAKARRHAKKEQLSAEVVQEIRRQHWYDRTPIKQIAKNMDQPVWAIYRIVVGKSYDKKIYWPAGTEEEIKKWVELRKQK